MSASDSYQLAATIEYLDPTQKIEGKEGRSKLLCPDSKLYSILKKVRDHYIADGSVSGDLRSDFHTELIGSRGNRSQLVPRCQELQGYILDVGSMSNWTIMMEHALVVKTPEVSGYGPTHITVCYFPTGVPEGWRTVVESILTA